MGKGKNNGGGQGNQGEEGSNDQNHGGTTIVLGVYIHCQGCAETIKSSLIGFDGVETIQVDEKNHRAIVKGKKADPIKVTERLRKKSGKHVELISPIPKPKKQENKEPKKEEKKVVEVILKVYMHCESCAKEVKQCIHKLEGVQTVDAELKTHTVRVKGTMSPETLVEFISRRAGRHAQILKVNKHGGERKDNKNEKDQGERDNNNNNKKKEKNSGGYKGYTPELLHAPQLFSDENPNACSLM